MDETEGVPIFENGELSEFGTVTHLYGEVVGLVAHGRRKTIEIKS